MTTFRRDLACCFGVLGVALMLAGSASRGQSQGGECYHLNRTDGATQTTIDGTGNLAAPSGTTTITRCE